MGENNLNFFFILLILFLKSPVLASEIECQGAKLRIINKIISCDETNKVLNENYNEIKNVIQNAYDDAVLIDCDEKDFKNKIIDLVDKIEFSLGRK